MPSPERTPNSASATPREETSFGWFRGDLTATRQRGFNSDVVRGIAGRVGATVGSVPDLVPLAFAVRG